MHIDDVCRRALVGFRRYVGAVALSVFPYIEMILMIETLMHLFSATTKTYESEILSRYGRMSAALWVLPESFTSPSRTGFHGLRHDVAQLTRQR